MANVVINGQTYNGITAVALALAEGGNALFQAQGEGSGGSIKGIVEIAAGEFSVASANAAAIIRTGMSTEPDAVVCVPKFWNDAMDANGVLCAKSKFATIGGGRRAVEGNTTHFAGELSTGSNLSGDITLMMSTLSKFQPTYVDADGNTQTQVYRWVAVKFAE